jgi:hypothetical protein
MRYYLHITTDREMIVDPDGEEFPDLDSARLEAEQSARSVMVSELEAGRSLSAKWSIQIANARGVVLSSLSFGDILGRRGPSGPDEIVARANTVTEGSRQAVVEARGMRQEIRDTRAELRTLSRLVMALRKTSH